VFLRKRRGKKPPITRSLYSSLVENFVSAERSTSYDLNITVRKLDDSRASPSQQQEQSGADANEVEGKYRDGGHAEKLADIGYDNIDMKRSARARPPSMSISQGFSSHVRRSMSHSVGGAVGHPLNNMAKLPGPIGFAMALAVAALGLKTAVAKQGFLPGSPQKVCEKCEGYGVQQCHVCQGRGVLNWEGKLRRTDPCPLCFGSCLKKCSNCGGAKMKKGIPPAMVSKLQLKAGANRI